MSTILQISDLSYSIGDHQILSSLNLTVKANQYFAIAGINGAGKSTLIKIILDLLRPSQGGTVKIFGTDNREPTSRQQVVYLPEKFDVKKHVGGLQYLHLVAAMYQQPLDEHRCVALAEKLDFPTDRLVDKSEKYSKGMVQKLGLISCFMLDTPFLILDEPLSGLDPKARYCFKELMLEQREEGRTVLYSTHMLADAEELCDQFAILHDSEFKYLGTPADCMATFGENTLEKAYMSCINSKHAG